MSFPNIYTHRKVAEAKAKSCDICYKLSSSVLITPDNKDWFYICPAHLKDPGFCTPKIDQAAIEARKKRELEEEIERVKKEYKERQKQKKNEKKKEEEGGGEAKSGDDESKDDNKADEDKKQKVLEKTEPSRSGASTSPAAKEEEPRVFELKSTFYNRRLSKKRQAEIARRNFETMQDPNFFPSVPKGFP